MDPILVGRVFLNNVQGAEKEFLSLTRSFASCHESDWMNCLLFLPDKDVINGLSHQTKFVKPVSCVFCLIYDPGISLQ